MKKIIYSFVGILLLTACSDDVKFSDPGLQANKNNTVWKAVNVNATQDASGTVTITANAADGSLILKTAGSVEGKYILGTANSNNKATHTLASVNGAAAYVFDTSPIAGPAAAISSLFFGGSAYSASSSAATTTTGIGAGLTVATTVSAGSVTNAAILSPGNNYFTGDIIAITGGNNLAIFSVLNVEGSNGEIVISNSSDGTITGTFQFNAKGATSNPHGSQNVGFQKGNFYRIPLKQL